MGRYITVFRLVRGVMLCIGSVYAWSIFAAELTRDYAFSASQAQLIFGLLIAIFPVTMIFVGQLGKRYQSPYIGHMAATAVCRRLSDCRCIRGQFPIVLAGIGVLGGIATGFGYCDGTDHIGTVLSGEKRIDYRYTQRQGLAWAQCSCRK